jgi:hypothetical protein
VEAIPWPSAAQARDESLLEERAAQAVEEAEGRPGDEAAPAKRKRKKKRKR